MAFISFLYPVTTLKKTLYSVSVQLHLSSVLYSSVLLPSFPHLTNEQRAEAQGGGGWNGGTSLADVGWGTTFTGSCSHQRKWGAMKEAAAAEEAMVKEGDDEEEAMDLYFDENQCRRHRAQEEQSRIGVVQSNNIQIEQNNSQLLSETQNFFIVDELTFWDFLPQRCLHHPFSLLNYCILLRKHFILYLTISLDQAVQMSYDFDYFVIGAGSGGVRTSRIAASHGAKVAVAEDSALGGTCVNVGCVPKKLMTYGAHFSHDCEDAHAYGWDVQKPTVQWSRFIENKNKEILRLNGQRWTAPSFPKDA
eukprot:768460-Hanusia_phi.AAC.4